MPSAVLTDYVRDLDVVTGATLADADLIELLLHGVDGYNAFAPRPFALTGTVLDRTPTDVEKRLLIGFGQLLWLDRQLARTAQTAVVHSNVAGRTDTTEIPRALREQRKELWDQLLTPLLAQLQVAGAGSVAGEVHAQELGETLPYASGGPWRRRQVTEWW